MVSGGGTHGYCWLACVNISISARLQGYSHGDINGRELSIVKQIFKALNINVHLEPLESSMYDLETLQKGFDRVENVVHAFWHRAGVRLSEAGVDCVSSGIFGEVIAGRHGMGYLIRGWDRKRFVAPKGFR